MKQYLVWVSAIILVLVVVGYITVVSIFPLVRSGFSLSNKWTQPAKGEDIRCMSVSQDGIILFNTRHALNALEAKTGTPLWSNNEMADDCPGLATSNAFITLSEHSLSSVETKTGKLLWQQALPNSLVELRAASEKYIVLNYQSDRIDVYDIENGLLLWTSPAERGYVDAYINGDIVYYVGDKIKALNGKTGDVIWEQELDITGSTFLSEGMLFYEGGNLFDESTANVVAFDLSKRKEIWRIQMDSRWLEEFLINGNILFLADANYLYALDKQNGRLIWQVKSSSPINLASVDNNIVAVEGFTRIVKAFDQDSGVLRGEIYMALPQMLLVEKEAISSWNDTLFLHNRDTIYAYRVKQP